MPPYFKRLREPNETTELEGVTERQVELGDGYGIGHEPVETA
jgi:hypothetical protein